MADSRASGLFSLPVGENFLVYGPSRRFLALVNGPAVRSMSWSLKRPGDPLPPELRDLAEDLLRRHAEPPPRSGPLDPLFLGLLPTRGCNCQCAYCDFGAWEGQGRSRDMAPAMAAAAVGWYADFLAREGRESMVVHLFGGEPFIRRETVEVAVHRSRLLAARHGLDLHLEASTNGLFEPGYAQFVGDNFNAVVLSLDGFPDSHDRHRPIAPGAGSFAWARGTAEALSRTQTRLCLRCCVTTLNVGQLSEIAEFFCAEFQPEAINFEPLTVNRNTRAAALEPPDPYEFARCFVSARAKAKSFGIRAVYASCDGAPWSAAFCPVGRDAIIVSPDGRASGCYLPREAWLEKGLDLDVGRLAEDGEMIVDLDAVDRLRELSRDKPFCGKCFCRPVCSGGCHVHRGRLGSPGHYDDFCVQTRLIAAAGFLEDLGKGEEAASLLADFRAMEALALQPSDLLEDA